MIPEGTTERLLLRPLEMNDTVPKRAYDWLTTGTFVGVLSGAGDADHPAVRITFYQAK